LVIVRPAAQLLMKPATGASVKFDTFVVLKTPEYA
jgi:hypothetical protein